MEQKCKSTLTDITQNDSGLEVVDEHLALAIHYCKISISAP